MASSIRVFFVVESGTDVRIVEKLRERVNLTLLARKIPGGVEVSQPISNFPSLYVFPSSRIRSAASIFLHLWRERAAVDVAVVQGYGLAALATNFWGILAKKP